MLEKLDTLIAFVVVMLGVSLIITLLTQTISTVLGLRGSNLLWGIETLLKELAPGLPPAAPGNPLSPRALAAGILTHPLISDSTFSRAGDMWLIGPIVNFLLKVPVIGWLIRRWRYATAIGANELARVLEAQAAALPAGHAVKVALTNLLTASDPEADRRARLLNAALAPFVPPAAPAVAPGYVVQVDKIIQQATDSARKSVGKLEAWFNSSMDRVSQRFVMQMRLWTIAFAFCLAFAVHLDSFGLLDQISTNAAVRSALVGMKDDMLGQAKAIIPQAPAQGAAAEPATEVPVSPEILQDALDRLKKSAPEGTTIPAKLDDGITTVKAAEKWLTDDKHVPADTVAKYRSFVISALLAHADTLNKQLQKAGVDIIPNPYPGDPKQSWLRRVFHFDGNRNRLGILLTAAFLSLGAPFWYNALKNLSNLRTVVANKQDQAA